MGASNQIHYWTDSPTLQYRNKTIFSVVSRHEETFGVKAVWNYFEAGHGKGPVMVLAAHPNDLPMKPLNKKK